MRLQPICSALLLSALFPCSAFAASEYQESIPIELVRALLGGGNTEATIYSEIPDGFPEFTLPDGARVLGALERGPSLQLVLATEQSAARQRQLLIRDFEEQGYTTITREVPMQPQRRGFVAPFSVPDGMPVQLCHEQHGMLIISINGRGNDQGLTLQASTAPNQVPCDAMMGAGGAQRGFAAINLQQHMPMLAVPGQATISNERRMAFVSSNAGTQSDMRITLDWPVEQLQQHMAEQLLEQDWVQDSAAVGDISAISGWSLEAEDEQMFGTLQILKTPAAGYELRFSLQQMPEQP